RWRVQNQIGDGQRGQGDRDQPGYEVARVGTLAPGLKRITNGRTEALPPPSWSAADAYPALQDAVLDGAPPVAGRRRNTVRCDGSRVHYRPTQLYAPLDAMSRPGTCVIAHYPTCMRRTLIRVRGSAARQCSAPPNPELVQILHFGG